jgi:hypothetical protein
MTITAKYAGTCPICRQSIAPGQKVEWAKGSQARHVACATATPQAAPVWSRGERIMVADLPRGGRRGGSRRTGCSCGSREDYNGDLIPSDRNCASCEHDA